MNAQKFRLREQRRCGPFKVNIRDKEVIKTLFYKLEIRVNVCYNGDPGAHMAPSSKSYLQAVFGDMTSVVYSKVQSRNPAIPVITALVLILLANFYSLSFCKTPTTDIISSFMARGAVRL
jgi:hypothetical protein